MRLFQMIIGSLVTLAGGLMAGAGARKALQIPTLAVRRLLVLALGAIASLALIFVGVSHLLSGLAEISALYQAPWVFSVIVGAVFLALGGLGMYFAMKKDTWAKPVEPQPAEHSPLMEALMALALQMVEERLRPKSPTTEPREETSSSSMSHGDSNGVKTQSQWSVN